MNQVKSNNNESIKIIFGEKSYNLQFDKINSKNLKHTFLLHPTSTIYLEERKKQAPDCIFPNDDGTFKGLNTTSIYTLHTKNGEETKDKFEIIRLSEDEEQEVETTNPPQQNISTSLRGCCLSRSQRNPSHDAYVTTLKVTNTRPTLVRSQYTYKIICVGARFCGKTSFCLGSLVFYLFSLIFLFNSFLEEETRIECERNGLG